MDEKLKMEMQTMYRMGASQKKIQEVFGLSRSTVNRACRNLPRDIRDDKVKQWWRDGLTLKEVMKLSRLRRSSVYEITGGIRNGRWNKIPTCDYCGKEFKQKRYKTSIYCRRECKRRGIVKKLSRKRYIRNEDMKVMRANGMTLQSIANKYKLTRQRVWVITHVDFDDV